jgi:hypothetical protein
MPETSDIPVSTAQLTASLAVAAYRLPQLLNTTSESLKAETTVAVRSLCGHRETT